MLKERPGKYKTNLKHLCQKIRKLTKSEGDIKRSEDASSDQIRGNLSIKVSTDNNRYNLLNKMGN